MTSSIGQSCLRLTNEGLILGNRKNKTGAWFQFKSIRSRQVFWLLLVAIIPLMLFGFIIYHQRVASIKAEAFLKLTAIRDLKVQQLNGWLEERTNDINSYAECNEIKAIGKVLNNAGGKKDDISLRNEIRDELNSIRKNFNNYHEVFILHPDSGIVEVSTDTYQEGKDKSDYSYFAVPLLTGKPHIKDIYYSKTLNMPSMTFSTPIYSKDHPGQIVGILVERIELKSSLYKFLLEQTGLGSTGETLIVQKGVIVLNKLRRYDNVPLQLKIEATPAVNASQGRTGVIEAADYRGIDVLAAYTYMPRVGWGIVIKQDQKEIYDPIQKLIRNIIIILASIAVVVTLLAFFLAENLSRPIMEMATVTKKIQDGDLTARNKVVKDDELGFLASSFNNMAEVLQNETNERKLAETISLRQTKVVNAIDKVLRESLVNKTEEEVCKKFLETAEMLTESKFGFIGEINTSGSFDTLAVSNLGWDACEINKSHATSLVLKMKIHGIYGSVLKAERSEIVNDPGSHPDRIGTPEGHPLLTSFLGVPLKHDDKTFGMIALGNKKAGYKKCDLESIENLSTVFVEALMHMRTQEKLKEVNNSLVQECSERERIQEELVMKEKFAVIGRVSGSIAHDIRHPLTTIKNSSYFLNMTIKDPDEKTKKHLRLIDNEVNHANEIITSLTRLSETKVPEKSKLNTNEYVKEFFEEYPLPKRINHTLKLNSECPDIMVDRLQLRQVFSNLTANAVRAMPEEGMITVKTETVSSSELSELQAQHSALEGDFIEISFEDTGSGIAKDDLHKIFEPFFTKKGKGMGLGLSIVKEIIVSNDGHISVESEEGKGSTFRIRFPVVRGLGERISQ